MFVHAENSMIGLGRQMMSEMVGSLPGIDEAMSFSQVMRLIQDMNFSCVVFDTAPTGHTLRLLQFPSVIENGLGKLLRMKATLGPMMQQMARLMGMPDATGLEATSKMETILPTIRMVNEQFKNPVRVFLVCLRTNDCVRAGTNDICVCMHCRISIALRNRTTNSRADEDEHRYA
jgi:arsenite-transporting ATPase